MKIKIIEIRKPGTKDERVFMKVMQKCNLSDFIVYDETFDDEGEPSNLMHTCIGCLLCKPKRVCLSL